MDASNHKNSKSANLRRQLDGFFRFAARDRIRAETIRRKILTATIFGRFIKLSRRILFNAKSLYGSMMLHQRQVALLVPPAA